MSAGEAELVADEVGEGDAHLDLFLVALAVDRQGDLARLTHGRPMLCRWRGHTLFPERAATLRWRGAGGRTPARGHRRAPRSCGSSRRPRAGMRCPVPCRLAHAPTRSPVPARCPCRPVSPPRG